MKSAVIGSGIGGLATALRLRNLGHEVVVYEQNATPGGKIRSIRKGGYRWDGGPSLFTMPWLVDELFELFNKDPRDYYNYRALDVACLYLDKAIRFRAYTDPKQFAKEAKEVLGASEENVLKYLENSKYTYDVTKSIFITPPKANPVRASFSRKGLRVASKAFKIGAFKNLNSLNQRLNHDLLIKIFNRYATYNGSNPYKAPGVLHCIASLEHGTGVAFPEKGIYSIIEALYKLAIEVGVKFRFETTVENVEQHTERWKIEEAEYDNIVINGDVYSSQRLLKKKTVQQPSNTQLSTSGVVFYWGVKHPLDELEVHNILFANDYEKEFKFLDSGKVNTEDLTVYIYVSSKEVKSDAPTGGSNLFVMVNTPPSDQGIDETMLQEIRGIVLKKIEEQLGVDLESLIEEEELMDSKVLYDISSSYNGALYGLNSNSLKNIMKRPLNKTKEKGLYFVGGSVFPGGGIPMCLNSAKNIESLILQQE